MFFSVFRIGFFVKVSIYYFLGLQFRKSSNLIKFKKPCKMYKKTKSTFEITLHIYIVSKCKLLTTNKTDERRPPVYNNHNLLGPFCVFLTQMVVELLPLANKVKRLYMLYVCKVSYTYTYEIITLYLSRNVEPKNALKHSLEQKTYLQNFILLGLVNLRLTDIALQNSNVKSTMKKS